ncbi:MAG: CRISPR-associated protein Csh2 [Bacteroidales bacterium]|jgi:CRISPR-associated protein Csh2|nr:CRISPR-associated protein Csh2 [Bacteroidales bacterium]
MMSEFKNRVFGCAVVKAINSNYNADFSGQPRTLPSGIVYATDKAFKYTIKNYLKDVYSDSEYILYFKRLKNEFTPDDLTDAYKRRFQSEVRNDTIETIARNLLSCIDVRLFGATFAPKGEGIKNKNISIHGPVQINHGVNIWKENNIFSEQIMSPFRNPGESGSEDKQATTLGRQSKLEEGHYLHHFSINPKNLIDVSTLAGEDAKKLSEDDILKLKEAMRRGVTWYDSASKAGAENEMLVWVQLNEDSKIVLPNFTTLIMLDDEKINGKCVYDFAGLKIELERLNDEIASIEVYYNKQTCSVKNLPVSATEIDL